MKSNSQRMAVAIAVGGFALTLAAIDGFKHADHGVVRKSDRLRMEFTVACGAAVVSDAANGCDTIVQRAPRTKPGVVYETTAYQDGANTTVMVKRRLEK